MPSSLRPPGAHLVKQVGFITHGIDGMHALGNHGCSVRGCEKGLFIGFGLVLGDFELTEMGFSSRLDAVRQWE